MDKPLTFKTPGLECQHADIGCCPKCHPYATKNFGCMRTPLKDNVSKLTLTESGLSHVSGRRLAFNLTQR